MKMKTVPDSNDRVRCFYCERYSATLSVPIPNHDATGKPCTKYLTRKGCVMHGSVDPIIKRRCGDYQPLPAWRREPLPD